MFVGGFGGFFSRTPPAFVQRPGLSVEPIDDRTREEYGNDKTDEHFDSEEDEAEEESEILSGGESPNQGDVCHRFVFGTVGVELRGERKDGYRAQERGPQTPSYPRTGAGHDQKNT